MFFPSALISLSLVATSTFNGEGPGERIAMSVLYAGEEGHAREVAFVSFLREHFTKVESIDASKLDVIAAQRFDVVVADGFFSNSANGIKMRGAARLELPPEFSKPTILVATAANAVEKISKLGSL
jgi:hypothetical protein